MVNVFEKRKADITHVQEMRWTGPRRKRVGCSEIYCRGQIKFHTFVVEIVAGRVLVFTPVDKYPSATRIKAKFYQGLQKKRFFFAHRLGNSVFTAKG